MKKDDDDEDNRVRSTSQTLTLILVTLSILSILFSGGFYVINRVSDVEKRVEVECELRKRTEKTIDDMNKKIDKILEKLK